MIRRRRESAEPADALTMFRALNELSSALRNGFTAQAAAQIATTTRALLDARVVAVTDDTQLLATAGDTVDWEPAVERHARIVLDRRRRSKPTIYETTIGREQAEVAVSVLASDDVHLGTIHVLVDAGADSKIAELHELTELVAAQLELAELEQSRTYAAEAELRALRAQISPHFLHNALTAIAALVITDPVRARSLIATFAGFLRASFREQSELTTVAEELRLVEAYLELEHARFGDRFTTALDIAPEALPVQIPLLTIQPLVENAIRHGLEARPGAGRLMITAQDAGPEIAVIVEDDGVGIDPDQLERALSGDGPTTHVGILSVDTRLRRRFGDEYGLTIATGADAGTSVTMRLPKYMPGL